jgi:hypothetical protein
MLGHKAASKAPFMARLTNTVTSPAKFFFYKVLRRHFRIYCAPFWRESVLIIIHEIVGENVMTDSIY